MNATYTSPLTSFQEPTLSCSTITGTQCNPLQQIVTATQRWRGIYITVTYWKLLKPTATHCYLFQPTPTQPTVTYYNPLQPTTTNHHDAQRWRCMCVYLIDHTISNRSTHVYLIGENFFVLQHTAMHYNTVQHTTTQYNTLQHHL